MAAPDEAAHDDVELGDLENESFIPKPYHKPSVLTRWMPQRLRDFFYNLSRIKLMLILLAAFIFLLVFIGWIGGLPVSVTIPAASLAVSAEVAKELANTAIPDYVLTYAPLVFLDKADTYYPSDMATHVASTHATLAFTKIDGAPDRLSLQNLNMLNDLGGESIYLTSNEELTKYPKYLHASEPDSATLQTKDAISCVVVVVDKGKGIMDAFYMYFYTFNQGPTVFGHELGDHLGDWEHNMVRFENGVPKAVWYSQHEYGEAYSYDAVPKVGKRPLAYTARGSHANYVTVGKHDLHNGNEQIPASIVYDYTSNGPLWDPTLSAYYYTWSTETKKFTPAKDDTPVNYLYFEGKWGDEERTDEMKGQDRFHDFHKWTGGPQGPLFKHLDRSDVCLPNRLECVIMTEI